jgi:hypothetical protein
LRFAVLAIETGGSGAALLGQSLAEQVRKRLQSIGYDSRHFTVAVGWADYQHGDGSKQRLINQAEASLATAAPVGEGISLPSPSRPPPVDVTDLEPAH